MNVLQGAPDLQRTLHRAVDRGVYFNVIDPMCVDTVGLCAFVGSADGARI